MTECRLPARELKAPDQAYRQLMIGSHVAREWAIDTGRAEVVDDALQPINDPDTLSETIIDIGNSERQAEDFGFVYRIIARANSAITLSERVLARMVETAAQEFDNPPMPLGPLAA